MPFLDSRPTVTSLLMFRFLEYIDGDLYPYSGAEELPVAILKQPSITLRDADWSSPRTGARDRSPLDRVNRNRTPALG